MFPTRLAARVSVPSASCLRLESFIPHDDFSRVAWECFPQTRADVGTVLAWNSQPALLRHSAPG